MTKLIGILALQGAYEKHVECLSKLDVKSRLIRKPDELNKCSALIIPGGESTTISLLIQEYDLYEPIRTFANTKPVMGICAGLILMATEVDDERVLPLGLISFRALRNHYGTQVHSFTADIKLNFDNDVFRAHFIRAPFIEKPAPETEVIASYNVDIVMIGSGQHVALSFHPELTSDTRIHDYWLNHISQ